MTAVAPQTQREAALAVEAHMAGWVDGVRYATRTSSYTRSPSAAIREAYAHGFDAGLAAYRQARGVADGVYAPKRARLHLVKGSP